MILKKFGQNLSSIRNFSGLKQDLIADKLELNRTTWSNYETSKSEPNLTTLTRIVDFFGIPMTWLFCDNAYLIEKLEELKKEGKSIPKSIPNGIPNEDFLLKVEEPQGVYNRVQKDEVVSGLRQIIETQKAHIASLNTTIQLLQEKIERGN